MRVTIKFLPNSTKEIDGMEKPVMHACGHDMHVSSLTSAAKKEWSGTLICLFSEDNFLCYRALSTYYGVSRALPWHYKDNKDNIKKGIRITFGVRHSEHEPEP